MKILMITLMSLFTLLMSNSAFANAQVLKFVAGDNTIETKFCISLAENNLVRTKSMLNHMLSSTIPTTGKAKYASRAITCNNLDIVHFTAQYHSGKTFNYINRHAISKYKLTEDQVEIIDLARSQLNINKTVEVAASQ